MSYRARILASILASGLSSWVSLAAAASPFATTPPTDVLEASPAYRYANMSDEETFRELGRRGIAYERLAAVPGVRAPIRLAHALHGVHIHSSLPENERTDSPFEILDARLALALDDFTALLESHDVVELVHYTMYRPNVAKTESEPEGGKAESAPRHALKGKDGNAPKAEKAPAKKTKKKAKKKGESNDAKVAATKTKSTKSKAPKKENSAEKTLGSNATEALAAKISPTSASAPAAQKAVPVEPALSIGVSADGSTPTTTVHSSGSEANGSGSPAPASASKPKKRHAKHDKAVKTRHASKSGSKAAADRTGEETGSPTKGSKSHGKSPTKKPGDKAHSKDGKSHATLEETPKPDGEEAAQVETSDAAPVKQTTWAPPGTRHPAGLAIDVGALRKSDGRWLMVADHFSGHVGSATCGSTAKPPTTAEGRELWSIVCESSQAGLFSYVLTPNYNVAHADHFHMEIKPGSRLVLFH